jgi:hypothetical protein
MGENTIDVYVVQNPSKCVTSKDPENCEGFLAAFATYFLWNHPIVVQDIADFIRRVRQQSSGAKIKNLIIGSHGDGGRLAYFRIGNDMIDQYSKTELDALSAVAPLLAQGARVFIVACHTGDNHKLLQKVSTALGGVRVYGYPGRIESDGFDMDYGTKQIVCYGGSCIDTEKYPCSAPRD